MLELKLEKYIKILLYLVPFLALIFIEGFYFPFIITKTVFFRLIIQFGLSLYLLLLALNFKKYKPRFNLAFILVGVFFLVELTAAIFGLDFYKSFWSDFERMEGVISLIYLAVYLFLLQVFLREKADWLFYVQLILISSALVSLYGLAQKFNILPVFEAGIGRATSTIGNAAFLAGYLLVAIGLGVYYYFNEARQNYKYLTLAATGLNLIVLLLTLTRGAILGVSLGLLVFLLLNVIFLSGKVRKNSAIILLAVILVFGTFYFFRSNFSNTKIEFINRMATISTADGSVNNRLVVWRMAVNDFKYHPWLGIGMENFEVVYNKYYTPDISENWFDRTHNVYLDQLMAGGVIGLSAYLSILFYLFFKLFKARREDYWRFSVFTGLLTAYAIHNFFVFDTLNTSFLYIFIIGLVSYRTSDVQEDVGRPQPNNQAFNYAFVILIILNILVFYKLIYLPVKINRAMYIGYYYAVADTFRSYENFKQALNYKFGSVEGAVQLNKMNDVVEAQTDLSAATKAKYLALNREKLEFASANFPLDIKTKMYLGQLILNNYEDIKELDEAESLLLESKKLSPGRIEPYYLLYNIYSKKGEKEKARAVLEELVRKLPWYGGAKIMLMGDLFKEDPARAEELFKQGMKQFGFLDFGGLKKIIAYLLEGKRYAEAAPYYKNLIEAEPKRFDYRLDLAQVYYLSGDIDGAVGQINIIQSNSPDTLIGYEGLVNTINQAYKSK